MVASRGVELAIVVGGGNILRGGFAQRAPTVIQRGHRPLHGDDGHRDQRPGPARRDSKGLGCETRLMTTIRMDEVAEPFIRRRALSHLARGPGRSSWPPGPEVRSSPPTPPPRSEARSSGSRCCSRPPGSTGSTRPTPRRTRTLFATSTLPTEQVLREDLKVMDMTAIGMCVDNSLADPGLQLQEGRQHRAGHRRRAHRHLGLQDEPEAAPLEPGLIRRGDGLASSAGLLYGWIEARASPPLSDPPAGHSRVCPSPSIHDSQLCEVPHAH